MRMFWIIPLLLACGARPGSEDLDGDGYGVDRDCNDEDSSIHPGAEEICDGVDNDCDGLTDDASATDAIVFYADSDGDGFGNANATILACSQPEGYKTSWDDCDDTDEDTYPGAIELCDGNDNDCDLTTSEKGSATFWGEDGSVEHDPDFGGGLSSPDRTPPTQAGTLRVCEGVHFLEWELEHDLTVVAQVVDPPDAVTFHGGNSRALFRFGDGEEGSGGAVDLTLRGGTLTSAATTGAGGAVICSASSMGGSSVYVLDTVIEGNDSAGDGAAIYSEDCDLTMIGVEVTANEAGGRGAVFSSGTAVVVDSVFDGNRGGVYSALYLAPNSPNASLNRVDFFDNTLVEVSDMTPKATLGAVDLLGALSMDGVNVFSNHDDTGQAWTAGVYLNGAMDVDVLGSVSTRSGVYGNEGVGPGLLLDWESTNLLNVESSDFGENGTENDNLSGDVGWSGVEYRAPQAASFICKAGWCGLNADGDDDPQDDADVCSVGLTEDSSYRAMTSRRALFGPVVFSDSFATLMEMGANMYSDTRCVVDLYVLSSPTFESVDDVWTVEASRVNIPASDGEDFQSMFYPVSLTPDLYYAIAQAVTCPAQGLHLRAEAPRGEVDPDPGFGSFVGGVSKDDFDQDLMTGHTVTGLLPTSSAVLYTTFFSLIDLAAPVEGLCP